MLAEERELGEEGEPRVDHAESADDLPGQWAPEEGQEARPPKVEEELQEDEEREREEKEEDVQAASDQEHAKMEDEEPERPEIADEMEEEMYPARAHEQSEIEEEPRSCEESDEERRKREEDSEIEVHAGREEEQAEIEKVELERDGGQQGEIEDKTPLMEEKEHHKLPDMRHGPGTTDFEELEEKPRLSEDADRTCEPCASAERPVKRTPRRKEKAKGTVARANELDYLGLDPKLLERGEITQYQEVFQSFTEIFNWPQAADAAQKERLLREALQVFTQFCNIIGSLESQFVTKLPLEHATPSATHQALTAT